MIQNPVWTTTLDDLDWVKAMPMQYFIWGVAIVTVGTVRFTLVTRELQLQRQPSSKENAKSEPLQPCLIIYIIVSLVIMCRTQTVKNI